eukprot:Plantae.Rhodophyta-Hildenbrandia_rubra.ctg14364.p1 GENE.Plantae.Rhodophyta-Hildenbrandia_rubra.ctg14364~~Plantae.Rhodophyta-Hildenbrandia_rubra.ctg14364.p1  ORF type:complete len:365 (+),score=64.16 Plantae.Rhodophyta-Hildenbrandia_rubra.ctg14364:1713-2807(+)
MNGSIINYSSIEDVEDANGSGHRLESLFLDSASGKIFHGARGELSLETSASSSLAFLCPRCEEALKIRAGEKKPNIPLLVCRKCGWDSMALGYRTVADVRQGARSVNLEDSFRKLVRKLEDVAIEKERKGGKGLLRGAYADRAGGKGISIEEFAKKMEEKEDTMRGLPKGNEESWKGIEIDEQILHGLKSEDIAPWKKRVNACEWRISMQPPQMNKAAQYIILKSPYSNESVTPPNFRGSLKSLETNAAQVLPAFDAKVTGSNIDIIVRNHSKRKVMVSLRPEEGKWANCTIAGKLECAVDPAKDFTISQKLVNVNSLGTARSPDDDCRLMLQATFRFIDSPSGHWLNNSRKWVLRIHLTLPPE